MRANVSTFVVHRRPIEPGVIAALGADPLDCGSCPPAPCIEANTTLARLILLEGYSLFGRRPITPRALRQVLLSPGVPRSFAVLSFLPEEWLRCYPGGALLDEHGVRFQRLPCTRADLDHALDEASIFSPEELQGVAQRAGTAIGQARWSAQGFLEDLRGARDEALLARRLDALQRFSAMWWPGYFRRTFAELREAIDSRDASGAEDTIREFSEKIIPASVYEAFSELFHGATHDIFDRGLGPTLSAMMSCLRSRLFPAQLQQRLAHDAWWERLHPVLERTGHKLEEVRAAGCDFNAVLPARFDQMRDALRCFEAFVTQFISVSTRHALTEEQHRRMEYARVRLKELLTFVTTVANGRNHLRRAT